MIDVFFVVKILVASVANMCIGFAWYHPRVFGASWMRMAGVTPEMVERGKRRVPYALAGGLVAGMVMAYVLSYFGGALGVITMADAVMLSVWVWIGFVAPVLLGAVLWEQKSMYLYLINALYWLVAIIVMAFVLFF
ncbi:MAG TPA: DUF1761 domain-containing protein [Candidatus Paceibacterota bacterium]